VQDAAVVADHRDHVKSVRRPNRSTNSNVRARGVSMVCTVFVASVYYVTHFSVKFVAWHMIGGLLNILKQETVCIRESESVLTKF